MATPRLVWAGDSAIGENGDKYALQVEHVRGEPPYHTLWWYPAGDSYHRDLGPAREKNAKNWDVAGTRREVKALAQEHYTHRMREA